MSNTSKITLHSSEISCDGCVNAIRVDLEELEGVSAVSGLPEKQQVVVEFTAPATVEVLKAAMDQIGYPVDGQS